MSPVLCLAHLLGHRPRVVPLAALWPRSLWSCKSSSPVTLADHHWIYSGGDGAAAAAGGGSSSGCVFYDSKALVKNRSSPRPGLE